MYQTLLKDMIYDDVLNMEALTEIFDHPETLNNEQYAIITALLTKQLTNPEDLSAFAKQLLKRVSLDVELRGIDICGTGGSGIDRINASTVIGFILSSMGYSIVKHGNRAGSGRFGSFDLIEALGIPVEQSQAQLKATSEQCNLAFVYAPKFFPFLKIFASARKNMQVASVFNILGPLLNPFKPNIQFIGTPYKHYAHLLYRTARILGRQSVVIYGGKDKLDDITLSDESFVLDSSDFSHVSPTDFGLKTQNLSEISASTTQEKVHIAKQLIKGTCNTPHHQFVAMNVAFFLRHLDSEIEYKDAFNFVNDHIRSGKVQTHFNTYLEILRDTSE